MAAVLVLLLIGLLVAAVVFVASLFGAETTEGEGKAGADKAAAQGPQARSGQDGKERAAAKDKDKDAGKNDGGGGEAAQKEAEASKDDDDDAASDDEQDAEPTASPSAEPTAEPTEDSKCGDADVVLEASTDQNVYQQGENPELTLSVTNESNNECTINLGTSEMEYLITSGEDRVFSSADCQVEAVDNYQTLKADETEKAKLTWERTRTAPDCAPVGTEPQSGTYTLVTKLGERTSEEETFKLE